MKNISLLALLFSLIFSFFSILGTSYSQTEESRLDLAIRWHDVESVQKIIDERGQAIFVDGEGSELMPTPLFTAAFVGDKSITLLLIQKGVDIHAVNSINDNALYLAILGRRLDVIDILLEAGANLDPVFARNRYMLGLFVSRYPDIAVKLADSDPKFLDRFLEDDSAVFWAAEKSSAEFLSKLLERNSSLLWLTSKDHRCLLHYAASGGNLEIGQVLLNFEKQEQKKYENSLTEDALHAPQLKPPFSLIHQVSDTGFSSADYAMIFGQLDFIEFLKEQQKGQSVWGSPSVKLANAILYAERNAIRELLKVYDIEINDLAFQMEEPAALIHVAALLGNTAAVQNLLTFGADIDLKNSNGETALQIAVSNKKIAVAELLLQNGAKITFSFQLGDYSPLSSEMQELLNEYFINQKHED